MARAWERLDDGRVRLTLEPVEQMILVSLLDQVAHLLQPEPPGSSHSDPLAALLDLHLDTAVESPTDPVVARLLPDAHRDDPDIAAEFRRYTELDLRREKVARVHRALTLLTGTEEPVVVDVDAIEDWLRALNDVRLALGTRLGIRDDLSGAQVSEDGVPARQVYEWLGWLQDSLLEVLHAD